MDDDRATVLPTFNSKALSHRRCWLGQGQFRESGMTPCLKHSEEANHDTRKEQNGQDSSCFGRHEKLPNGLNSADRAARASRFSANLDAHDTTGNLGLGTNSCSGPLQRVVRRDWRARRLTNIEPSGLLV